MVESKSKRISKARQEEEKEKEFIKILMKFSPGTALRSALDDLMRARMGALLVVSREGISKVRWGGFKLNTIFTPQKLVEVAKMDGAIILSEDLRRIEHVNALLSPNVRISSKETGTRHQAAERTAKELNTIVLAVSERKNKITVYYKDRNYVLENSSEVLRKATETLQILEKQREIYGELKSNLNLLEINDIVTAGDICNVLQRIEIIKRISDMIQRSLVELGKEGVIVSMRLRELTGGLNKGRGLILKDYFKSRYAKVSSLLGNMDFDFLIETSNITETLFGEIYDKEVHPKGYRLLSKTNIPQRKVELLVKNFKNLSKIFNADKKEISKVVKNPKYVKSILGEIGNLREKILVGKQIT